jgi:hypothetical protein
VDIDEKVRCGIEHVKRWEEANPGLSYATEYYAEDEEKIYIAHELRESKAFRSLSRAALLIYLDFLSKRDMRPVKRGKSRKRFWVIQNNGEIVYPYFEAEEKGFSKTIFRNAIDELQNKGLIDITHKGQGGRKPKEGTGDVTKYFRFFSRLPQEYPEITSYRKTNFRANGKPCMKRKWQSPHRNFRKMF